MVHQSLRHVAPLSLSLAHPYRSREKKTVILFERHNDPQDTRRIRGLMKPRIVRENLSKKASRRRSDPLSERFNKADNR